MLSRSSWKYVHLDQLPLEYLNLSVRVFNSLRRSGITSVGDCVVMMRHGPVTAIRGLGGIGLNEIEQRLRDAGYWSFVEEAELPESQLPSHHPLPNLRIEKLGLSVKALQALYRVEIKDVRDCIRFFIQTYDDHPKDFYEHADKLSQFIGTRSHVPFFVFMFLEVAPILKERGYWVLIEDKFIRDEFKQRLRQNSQYADSRLYLFEIPIEYIKLSAKAVNTILRFGMTSIGDCVQFYARMYEGQHVTMPDAAARIMFGEVMDKMKENGFWSYVEAAH